MRLAVAIVVLAIVFATGVLLIVGAYQRWKWLVDPRDNWLWYSQTIVKRLCGTGFLRFFTYLVGAALVGACLVIIYRAVIS
jgi:hypothetical protein